VTQLDLFNEQALARHQSWVERVQLGDWADPAYGFQQWLGKAKALKDWGADVTVLIADDRSHAVMVVNSA
jgi:hypothetical protein